MHADTGAELRFDLRIVASWIEPGSRVLDLGCGDGRLLRVLAVFIEEFRSFFSNKFLYALSSHFISFKPYREFCPVRG